MALVLLSAQPVFTVLMMIERAYALLGYKAAGESLSADDAEYGRNALNAMLDGWNTQAMCAVSVGLVSASVAGASARIGPGMDFDTPRPVRLEHGCFVRADGLDYPLALIDRQAYAAIADKAASAGMPLFAYYESTAPTATVYFYPPAAQNVEIHLAMHVQMLEFADVTAEVTLAPGYRKAIEYSLAEELAPGIKELPMTVVRAAANARRAIRRSNVRVPVLDVGMTHARFDIYSGL